MHQPAPRKTYQKPSITVKGETLEAVDNFTQLGCTLFGAVNTDVEVNGRFMKTSSAFQRYHKNVWVRSRIGFSTKLNLYHPYCSPRSCKPLRPRQNSRYARQLNHFYIICPHKFLKIRWQDTVPDTEVLTKASIPRVHILRSDGHVTRMPDDRLPKQLLQGDLCEGKSLAGDSASRTPWNYPWKAITLGSHQGWSSLMTTPHGTAVLLELLPQRSKETLRQRENAPPKMEGLPAPPPLTPPQPFPLVPFVWKRLLSPDWPGKPSYSINK